MYRGADHPHGHCQTAGTGAQDLGCSTSCVKCLTALPLTPRVLANRVWAHLFGEGLVKSVDNFGITGDAPANQARI